MACNQSDDKRVSGRLDVPLRPNGEPVHYLSTYDPGFCNRAIEMGRQGYTYAQICSALDISKSMSERWRPKYEEWDESVKLAITASEAASDKIGFDNLTQKEFRDSVWKELRSDYKPIAKIEMTVTGEPTEVQAKVNETKDQYTEELHRSTI